MAPPGCKAIIQDRPENQLAWDSHGTLSYYIGIAENHYRNYKCYIPKTKAIQISDTVEFFPKIVQTPKTSSNDRLAVVLEHLIEVLKHPHPNTPFLDKGTTTNYAISMLEFTAVISLYIYYNTYCIIDTSVLCHYAHRTTYKYFM